MLFYISRGVRAPLYVHLLKVFRFCDDFMSFGFVMILCVLIL